MLSMHKNTIAEYSKNKHICDMIVLNFMWGE